MNPAVNHTKHTTLYLLWVPLMGWQRVHCTLQGLCQDSEKDASQESSQRELLWWTNRIRISAELYSASEAIQIQKAGSLYFYITVRAILLERSFPVQSYDSLSLHPCNQNQKNRMCICKPVCGSQTVLGIQETSRCVHQRDFIRILINLSRRILFCFSRSYDMSLYCNHIRRSWVFFEQGLRAANLNGWDDLFK